MCIGDPGYTSAQRVRAAEIETVKAWLTPGKRLLELGGGDGFQAGLLSRMGYEVSSIDVTPRPGSTPGCHPVIGYDGRHIPFPDASFDIVFSSNVLEHIVDLPATFAELRRVERRGCRGVHLVPSASWRFWTTVTHFPWLLSRLLHSGRPRRPEERDLRDSAQRNTPRQLLWKTSGLAPHGEYANSLSELYYFSRHRWKKLLTTNGFDIIHVGDNSLFYTGNGLLEDLPLDARRRLSRILGAACHLFVTIQHDSAEGSPIPDPTRFANK
jgi:SAM-dependent methyltransferase